MALTGYVFGGKMYQTLGALGTLGTLCKIGDSSGYQIRHWQIEDAISIVKYGNNRKIWRNLRDRFPNPYHKRDAEAFIARVSEASPRTAFAIATESEAIGSIGMMLGQDVHRFTAEMGYWLGEPFWGKGIMTQAVQFLTAWAIRDLHLHRIHAEPYATNPASHRVLEKAGFSKEGVLRSSVFKDGKVVDQVVYSFLGTEAHKLQIQITAGAGALM